MVKLGNVFDGAALHTLLNHFKLNLKFIINYIYLLFIIYIKILKLLLLDNIKNFGEEIQFDSSLS